MGSTPSFIKLNKNILKPRGEVYLTFSSKVAQNANAFSFGARGENKCYGVAFRFKKAKTSNNAVFADGAGGGSRTHMKLPSTDFESVASAIPPHQQSFFRYLCILSQIKTFFNFYNKIFVTFAIYFATFP